MGNKHTLTFWEYLHIKAIRFSFWSTKVLLSCFIEGTAVEVYANTVPKKQWNNSKAENPNLYKIINEWAAQHNSYRVWFNRQIQKRSKNSLFHIFL